MTKKISAGKKINKNLVNVVNILNNGEYHDGNAMGLQLNMTRSAIWKYIKKLVAYGVAIDSIKGKGYALSEPLILLDAKKIKKKIASPLLIDVFESIGSTNEYLKSIKTTKLPLVCLAEQQTQGKARLNRKWFSPFAKNIYFSCRYPFKKEVSELAGLSLVVGLAVFKTIQFFGIKDSLFLKWPNDLYYDSKKLAGILLEIIAESHDGLSHAIIGIGLNVNTMEDVNHQITQPWTSLQKILKKSVDRNEIVAELLKNILNHLNQFEQEGFSPFMQEWMKSDCLMNKWISLKTLTEKLVGTVRGINEQGQLLLEMANGRTYAFSAGDVTIMK